MTPSEFNLIKDAFSQIIDDIAGNPDWYEAARAVASDLGTLERKLEEKVSPLPSNLDEAAQKVEDYYDVGEEHGYLCCHRGDIKAAFKAGAEWMAGQFQKIEGKLVDWYETNDVEYCYGISTNESFEVPEGFYIKKK